MKIIKKISYVLILLMTLTYYSTLAIAKEISMDYEDADIKVVIKALSELTGKNFIIDSDVQGKVTIISPQKVSIQEVEKILESILNINGYTIVPTSSTISKIIPLAKARQANVQIFSGKEQQELKERMITQLIHLEYADAQKTIEIINPLLSPFGALSSYPPTNLLIITDTASNINKFLEIIKTIDKKNDQHHKIAHIFYLKNTDAEKIAESLNKIYEEKNKKRTVPKQENSPIIVANSETNSLITFAQPQEYTLIESIINQLDIVQLQVLVEVLIAEFSLKKSFELGFELAGAGGVIYGTPAGFSGAYSKGISKNILTGGDSNNNAIGIVEGITTIGSQTIPDIGALISLAEKDNDINILSIPQILTLNNEEARILVGNNLPFIKNSQVTPEGSVVKTFEFKDIGLILTLTPHINENGFVRLKINQAVEEITNISEQGAVETSKREVTTQLVVKDHTTAIIGGLITDTKRQTINKIPLLGDIPLLGHLFKKTNENKEKINLLIFITPHIIKTSEDLDTISQDKKSIIPYGTLQ